MTERSRPRTAAYLVFAVALGLLSLEGLSRGVERIRPPLPVDYSLGLGVDSVLFVPAPGAPGDRVTHPNKRAFFAEQRFSARKEAGTLRLAILGGSAVAFAAPVFPYVAAAVRAELGRPVEIINGGGASYGTHRLVRVLDELLTYNLDAVLLYSGHNEFEEVEQLHRGGGTHSARPPPLARSALYRVVRDTVVGVRVRAISRDHERRTGGDGPDVSRAWSHRFTADDVAERMRAYRENLGHMVDSIEAAGLPALIGVVPSNHMAPLLLREDRGSMDALAALYAEGRWEEGRSAAAALLSGSVARHQSSSLEAGIVRELAAARGLRLVDMEAAVIAQEPHGVPGETLFMDHCHLNQAGLELWARVVADGFVAALRGPESDR